MKKLTATLYILACLTGCTNQNSNSNTAPYPNIDSIIAHADTATLFENTAALEKDTTPEYRITEIVESVRFLHNSAAISQKETRKLKKLAQICSSDSVSYLKIFAFTDTIGSEAHNDSLAEKRALAVYKHIDPENKMKDNHYVTWLGESPDIYDLHFPQAHAQQNYVDIWIMTRKKKN